MENKNCDLIHPNGVKEKKLDLIDGYTIKYHANGQTIWSNGKMIDGNPDGYWEWYLPDGTIKRSRYFVIGEPVGEWVTYDSKGEKHKTTNRSKKLICNSKLQMSFLSIQHRPGGKITPMIKMLKDVYSISVP